MLHKIAILFSALFLLACNTSSAQKAEPKPADKVTPIKTATANAKPVVVFETSLGDITIETWPSKAPVTVKNFIQYVSDGFYDGVIFHRVIPGFVVQGGGFKVGMDKQDTRSPIKNESDNKERNLRGTLSMARTNDPHSASSQFFINLVNNGSLDYRAGRYGYAVFAKVVDGMNVVDSMAAKSTGRVGPYSDVPVEPIVIKKAYVKAAK